MALWGIKQNGSLSQHLTSPHMPKGVLAITKTILLEDCFLLPIPPEFWMSFNTIYTRVEKHGNILPRKAQTDFHHFKIPSPVFTKRK